MYAGIWADQRYRVCSEASPKFKTFYSYLILSCVVFVQLPPANEPSVFFGAIAKQFESIKPMASAAIDEAKRQAEKAAPAVTAAANKSSTPTPASGSGSGSNWFSKKE